MKIEEEINQSKFQSPHQKAVINLLFTANWFIGKQQDFFKPFGITGQQFNILRILKGQHPQSISATEMKSRMLDKNSDVSRLLNRLLSKELIQRRICPNDKRAADVTITNKGLELLHTLSVHQTEMDSVIRLSEAEAEQLSKLLDQCRG